MAFLSQYADAAEKAFPLLTQADFVNMTTSDTGTRAIGKKNRKCS